MVNAQKWLNTKIPNNQNQIKSLYIYQRQKQKNISGFSFGSGSITTHAATYAYDNNLAIDNKNQPYTYYDTFLEGELDLNDFVNLEQLSISGIDKNQKQKLTSLKIDKCVNLNSLSVNYTTLTELDLSNNFRLTNINKDAEINLYVPVIENLSKERNQVQFQIKKIVDLVQEENPSFKSEVQKITKENLDYQLACEKKKLEWLVKVAKNRLDENQQEWLDTLLETQSEILQNSSLFVRKQLEKVKRILAKDLSAEEIEAFCGRQGEIVELEKNLAGLQINEQQAQVQQANLSPNPK